MKLIAKFILWLIGWQIIGPSPNEPDKSIIIVAPHTSNWDFIIGLLSKFSLGLQGRFLGKHTLFRAPYGWIFRALGGQPVDRSKSQKMVDQVVKLFEENDRFILVLAPEGTRKKTVKWRTGFYYMAIKAEVPIIMVAMDYKKKAVIIEPPYHPTGDPDKDLSHIFHYYKDVTPLYHENFQVPEIN